MPIRRASDADSALPRESSLTSLPGTETDFGAFTEEGGILTAVTEEAGAAKSQDMTEIDETPARTSRHVSLYTTKGDEIIFGAVESGEKFKTDDMYDTEDIDIESFVADISSRKKKKMHRIHSKIIANDAFDFEDDFVDLVSLKTTRSKRSMRSETSWKRNDPEIDQLLEFGEISETESDIEMDLEDSYIVQEEITIPTNFFDDLGSIGDLSLISSTSIVDSEVSIEMPKRAIRDTLELDKGRFVNAITGQSESSEEELAEALPLEELVEEEEAEEEFEEEEEEEEEDLMLPSSFEDDIKEVKVEEEFNFWQQLELPEPKLRLIETNKAELARLEEERQKNEMILQFLNSLIDAVVKKSEHVHPNVILRKNLDKKKLMLELNKTLAHLDVEQKACFFLNRKTVEYYRRRKAFRSITEDNPDTINDHMERYKQASNVLDHLLTLEFETRLSTGRTIENLENEVRKKTEEANKSLSAMEAMIKNALQREKCFHLKMFVENQLSKMRTVRNEIAQVRYTLIQRQHKLAVIEKRAKELDDLGDGLHMSDFYRMRTESLALGKKIEERNNELNKLRTRCNADLHVLAHLREKQQMLRNTNYLKEIALRELLGEKKETREMLFEFKVQRAKIRNDIRELSYQGGLIDKPALMIDYDETMDRLVKKRAKVDRLRHKHHDLLLKIDVLEKKCNINDSMDLTGASN